MNDLTSAIENIKISSDEHKNQYTSTLKSNGISEYSHEIDLDVVFVCSIIGKS
jgi:hypothetical protein